MRKVTVDRGESGPRWPSPCIAEDRNGFTVFHLPGFAVPKIALVSSLLSPKVRLRSTFFSHPQPSTRCLLSAGAPPSPNSQHSHTFTAPPALRTIPPLPLKPFRRQAASCWSPHLPPVPLLAHRHGRCHEGPKVPGNCFDPGPCRRPARDYRSRSPIACRPILAPPRPLWAPRISVFASLSRLEIACPLGCATPNEEWPLADSPARPWACSPQPTPRGPGPPAAARPGPTAHRAGLGHGRAPPHRGS